jgi:hypothetical protein
MSILKFLHFPVKSSVRAVPVRPFFASACSVLAAAALWAGCAGGPIGSTGAAEKFAVTLANDKCEHEFGKRPFKTGRFPAARSGDRWLWGWLDAADGEGYTAQVSFHADRSQPEVQVYSIAADAIDLEAPDAPRLDAQQDPGPLTSQPEAAPEPHIESR